MFREIRRKDKAVYDREWIDDVLRRAQVVSLGINGRDGWPYVVPMSFGYDGTALYFHGAAQGLKIELLADSPKVCFQAYLTPELLTAPAAQNYSFRYRSVTGFGVVSEITDAAEKRRAFDILMDHYNGPHVDMPDKALEKIWAARLDIERVTGKRSPAE